MTKMVLLFLLSFSHIIRPTHTLFSPTLRFPRARQLQRKDLDIQTAVKAPKRTNGCYSNPNLGGSDNL